MQRPSALAALLKSDRGGAIFLALLLVVAIVVPTLRLLPGDGSAMQLSSYTMTLIAKYIRSRNADGTVLDGTRNFDEQIVSLGVTVKF